jgi:pimeloyl-ACP methyl ester carboxylesterase
VGIFGLSEGASISLLAAAAGKDVAFALPVSGALGIPPLEISRYRIEMMCCEKDLSLDEIQKALTFGDIQWAMLTGQDIIEWPLIRMRVERWPDEPWEELIALTFRCREKLTREEQQEVQKGLGRIIDTWKSEPWFTAVVVDMKKYEQMMTLDAGLLFAYLKTGPFAKGDWHHHRMELTAFPKVRCPVLALWGEKDRFVPVRRSAVVFRHCMASTKNEDVTCKILPGASHLLTRPGTFLDFTKDYPQVMADWIRARFPLAEK